MERNFACRDYRRAGEMEGLVPLSQEPIRHIGQVASDKHADWSYERLAALRAGAVKVRDSGFLWTHERTHLDEITERIDATVHLKRERDAYQASKNNPVQTANGEPKAASYGARA